MAEVLHAWVADRDFHKITTARPRETVAVVGHVASLTVALGRLCALGSQVCGTPLPHARPFLIEWDGRAWHCTAWPVSPCPQP
jgi:hypothetical protein